MCAGCGSSRGFQWSLYASSDRRYTEKWTLRDRITQPHAFAEIRSRLLFAITVCHANDPGFDDWPLGIDPPPGEDAISMSGVFHRVAIVTCLVTSRMDIPDVFGKYAFGTAPLDRDTKRLPTTLLLFNGGDRQRQ